MSDTNGFTNKEILVQLLEGQNKLRAEISELKDGLSQRPTRQELIGWIVGISAIFSVIFML